MTSQASSSLGEQVSVPMGGTFFDATPTGSECEADEPAYHSVPSVPAETIQSSAWVDVTPAMFVPIPTAPTADARKGNNNKLGKQQREFNKNIKTAVTQLQTEMATKASVEQVPTLHSLEQVQSQVDDKAAVQDIRQLQTKVTQLQSELATKANVEQVPTLQSMQQVQSEVDDKAIIQDVQQLQPKVAQLQTVVAQLQTELATKANVERVPTLHSMQQVQSQVDDKAAVQDVQQLQTKVAQLQTELATKANVEQVPTLLSLQQVQSEVEDKAAVQEVQQLQTRVTQLQTELIKRKAPLRLPTWVRWCMMCMCLPMLVATIMLVHWTVTPQLQTKVAQLQTELATQANVETVPTLHSMQQVQSEVDDLQQKVEQANQVPSKVGNTGSSLPLPNPRDQFRISALCYAAEQNSPDLIELLLHSLDAKEINSICGFNCETALIWAISANHTEVATAMIKHSYVDINLLCGGRSVLYYVMESGNVEIARQLLQQRRFTNNDGRVPYFVQGGGPHDLAYMGDASLYPSRWTIANLIMTGDEVSDAVSKRM